MNDFFTVLTLYPAIALTFTLIIGLLVGSFLNVVIYRLPRMMEAEWREQCEELLHCSADATKAVNAEPAVPLDGIGINAGSIDDASADSALLMPSDAAASTPVSLSTASLNSASLTQANLTQTSVAQTPLSEPPLPESAVESDADAASALHTETADEKKQTFNLCVPRSRCPHCGHQITALENIPIVSYLFLGGKCADCRAPISLRYPSIELTTGLLSMAVIYFFGATWLGLAALIFTWCLIALTMIDIDTQLLPDSITLPLVWLGLIVNSFNGFTSLQSALWGAVAGYLILWSIYWLFKLLTGKEGMGYGDFKLLAALGAWMGWQFLPQIILMSSLVGAVIGIMLMIIKKRGKEIPIPFGPYLAIAGWIALIWGDHINRQYLLLFVPH